MSGLVDQLEVAHVDLPVDVAGDVQDVARPHPDRLHLPLRAAELLRPVIEKVVAGLSRLDRAIEQQLLVDIARIERDEVLREFASRNRSISACTSGIPTTWLIGKLGYTFFMSGRAISRNVDRTVSAYRPRLTM